MELHGLHEAARSCMRCIGCMGEMELYGHYGIAGACTGSIELHVPWLWCMQSHACAVVVVHAVPWLWCMQSHAWECMCCMERCKQCMMLHAWTMYGAVLAMHVLCSWLHRVMHGDCMGRASGCMGSFMEAAWGSSWPCSGLLEACRNHARGCMRPSVALHGAAWVLHEASYGLPMALHGAA
eukprot:350616-Chlamydomonas_euryale.AAC.3